MTLCSIKQLFKKLPCEMIESTICKGPKYYLNIKSKEKLAGTRRMLSWFVFLPKCCVRFYNRDLEDCRILLTLLWSIFEGGKFLLEVNIGFAAS